MKILNSFLVLGVFFLFLGQKAFSTHLKAGEITAQRTGTLSYKFTLTLYTDVHSVDTLQIDEPDATLTFDDGTSLTVPRDAPGKIFIGNGTYKNTYTFYKTFSGLGTYKASYQRANRNEGILNIKNSSQTPFYLESSVSISIGDNSNSLPILTNPPIGHAAVGQKYIHNPAAFDAEGDSISYALTVPRQNSGEFVLDYRDPNYIPSPGGIFKLDPITGDLVWDAPKKAGLYNVAFIIQEWRKGKLIGYIVRDMQIDVVDEVNKKPNLIIPKDTCLAAGGILDKVIIATDPDGNKIDLSAYGGLFSLPKSSATFNASQGQWSPANGNFHWNTTCDLVREQPYQVVFKAQDRPLVGEELFDIKTWSIKILGPKPTGLSVSAASKGLLLNWDNYGCTKAARIEIYRKDCDSTDFEPEPCEGGLPGNLGFKKVGEVPATAISFSDTTNVKAGSFYCYRIVAIFPLPKGGKSYTSDEVCFAMNLGEPLPTNVTVEKTDSTNGKILVRWTQPFELDMVAFPGSYKYQVLRSDGINSSNYLPVNSFSNLSDTFFIDSLINTAALAYNYKVQFYYNGNVLKAETSSSSSVFLTGASGNKSAILNWSYSVPWNNQDEYHRIYRKINSGSFELIDSVFVTGNSGIYTASGLNNGDTIAFYVETQGRYCRDGLPEPLRNNSQIVNVIPHNNLPPCPPILSGPVDCIEEGIIQLTVFWKPDLSPGCNTEIYGYNVYYAEHEGDVFTVIAKNVKDTFFIDQDNFSLAGCYAVTALNFYGNESALSNKICVDICVYYELPNLISPNKDDKNDQFRPFPIPKNVSQVRFTVFNRWGERVYYSEDNINLDWQGKDVDGNNLPSGVYFYSAEVTFRRRLNRKDDVKILKGWVHVILNDNPDHHD